MNETLAEWIDALASAAPAPGGGAAAALQVCAGAALVEMVCNLTIGRDKYAGVEPLMIETRAAVRALRAQADTLRVDDSAAFGEVSRAYALPRTTLDERATRSSQIQLALRRATEVPLQCCATGVAVLERAEAIAAVANRNVISDIGAAAIAAKAGADASALNVRINLAAIKDNDFCSTTATTLDDLLGRAARSATATLAAVDAVIKRKPA